MNCSLRYLLIILILLLMAACSSKPHSLHPVKENTTLEKREVYVVSHGWHTGFIIPAKEVLLSMPALKNRFNDVSFIEVGWGDEGFYQAKEITTVLTLRALFWPTVSVVHVVAVSEEVSNFFPDSQIEKLKISAGEYSSLIKFISSSFYKNQSGDVLKLSKGIYGNSQFYRGTGDYYLMNTCNKWTAKGLKSAGMNISPSFKLTADSVMDYIQRENIIRSNQP